jgi:Putative peptidoglycan binding domain
VNRGSDPDDWFGGAAEDGAEGGSAYREDWLHDVAQPSPPWYETIDRRVAVAIVVAIAALIAILAAAGVFSGGSHPSANVAPTTTVAPPPTPTTTASQKPAVPAPTTTLKPGDTGSGVKVLQRALASLGHSTGKIDGDYGPATESAVKAFQTASGLKADGVVGPATLRALKAALRTG